MCTYLIKLIFFERERDLIKLLVGYNLSMRQGKGWLGMMVLLN